MAWERTSVGLDVHVRWIVAGVLDTATGQVWLQRLPAATEAVVAWVGSLPGPGDQRVSDTIDTCRIPAAPPLSSFSATMTSLLSRGIGRWTLR